MSSKGCLLQTSQQDDRSWYQDPQAYPIEDVEGYMDKMRVENITTGPSGGKRKRGVEDTRRVHWQDLQSSAERVQWAAWYEMMGKPGVSGLAGANGE